MTIIIDKVTTGHAPSRDRTKIMSAMDRVSARYGIEILLLATASLIDAGELSSMKVKRRTPRCTMIGKEMPVERA